MDGSGIASQIFRVLSSLPETIRVPFGLKHTLLTLCVCPLSGGGGAGKKED
jgi:hypothetical protein